MTSVAAATMTTLPEPSRDRENASVGLYAYPTFEVIAAQTMKTVKDIVGFMHR